MKSSQLLVTLLALSSQIVNAFQVDPTSDKKPKTTSQSEGYSDFINFTNDDTLHGKFLGLTTSGKIIWKNPSAEKNIAFTPDQIRMVVLNKGKLIKPFTHVSYITLTNQDTVPGEIAGLTNKTITLKTDYAGELKIPREMISSIDFLPLGDKIHYRGPFVEADWKTFPYSTNKTTEKPGEEVKPAWELKNFTLKNVGGSGVIMHSEDFTGKIRYTFKVSYSNSVMPSFIISSDMEQPEVEEKKAAKEPAVNAKVMTNRASKITEVIGTGLIFRLSNYSSSLNYYGFDENGNSITQSIPNMLPNARTRKPRGESIIFDVRVNKEEDSVLLYADDAMVGQWDITGYTDKLKGGKTGFVNLYTSTTNKCMVSDIVISAWNGVTDPAASMENADRDTILLSNGTDRYSGAALKLLQNKLLLKAPYAELEIPTDQIQSLYFAKKDRKELPAKAESEVSLRFHGSGRLTGTLAKASDGKITLDTSVLGKLTIDPDYVSAYEFEDLDYAYEIIK